MKFDHSGSQSTKIDQDAYCDQPCARCHGLEEENCIVLADSSRVWINKGIISGMARLRSILKVKK